jgi:hypothetical protein
VLRLCRGHRNSLTHKRARSRLTAYGALQDLTGVRILGIHGSEHLGVAVPKWCAHTSTPLRQEHTLGQKVRLKRRLQRREQRAHDRALEQGWLQNRQTEAATGAGVFDTRSYPLSPEELEAASDAAEARAALRSSESPAHAEIEAVARDQEWKLDDELSAISDERKTAGEGGEATQGLAEQQTATVTPEGSPAGATEPDTFEPPARKSS